MIDHLKTVHEPEVAEWHIYSMRAKSALSAYPFVGSYWLGLSAKPMTYSVCASEIKRLRGKFPTVPFKAVSTRGLK